MQIKIIYFGKIKNKNLLVEIEELKKRISRIEIIELKEVRDSNINLIKKKEFEQVEKYLNSSNYNVVLSESGVEYETKEFYNYLKKIDKTIVFIVSGPYGPSVELLKKADLVLSLSKMIFTHEQAIYMLFEQLYRAQCFDKGIDYTK